MGNGAESQDPLFAQVYDAFRFEISYEPTKLIDSVMLGLVTVHRTIWETP